MCHTWDLPDPLFLGGGSGGAYGVGMSADDTTTWDANAAELAYLLASRAEDAMVASSLSDPEAAWDGLMEALKPLRRKTYSRAMELVRQLWPTLETEAEASRLAKYEARKAAAAAEAAALEAETAARQAAVTELSAIAGARWSNSGGPRGFHDEDGNWISQPGWEDATSGWSAAVAPIADRIVWSIRHQNPAPIAALPRLLAIARRRLDTDRIARFREAADRAARLAQTKAELARVAGWAYDLDGRRDRENSALASIARKSRAQAEDFGLAADWDAEWEKGCARIAVREEAESARLAPFAHLGAAARIAIGIAEDAERIADDSQRGVEVRDVACRLARHAARPDAVAIAKALAKHFSFSEDKLCEAAAHAAAGL